MTWTNAFDLGECTVEVYKGSASPDGLLWSGVLVDGDDPTAFSDPDVIEGPYADLLIWLLDGSVYLGYAQPGLATTGAWQVNVVPSYPHDFPPRASDVLTTLDDANGWVAVNEGDGYIEFDGSEPGEIGSSSALHMLPDPRDLPGYSGAQDFIGVYLQRAPS
jgi:hypothetical protein